MAHVDDDSILGGRCTFSLKKLFFDKLFKYVDPKTSSRYERVSL